MMNGYTIKTTKVVVKKDSVDLYNSDNVGISIEDEGGGEFLELSNLDGNNVRIDFDEWPYVVRAVNQLLGESEKG
jgi:hypothetical protein